MLDFVSTREGVDPFVKRDAQMLAAFIAIRLRDLMQPTTQVERHRQRNVNSPALSAVAYFFEPGSAFEEHIALIGGDAATYRENLLGDHPLTDYGAFTLQDRNTVKLRHYWWSRGLHNTLKD